MRRQLRGILAAAVMLVATLAIIVGSEAIVAQEPSSAGERATIVEQAATDAADGSSSVEGTDAEQVDAADEDAQESAAEDTPDANADVTTPDAAESSSAASGEADVEEGWGFLSEGVTLEEVDTQVMPAEGEELVPPAADGSVPQDAEDELAEKTFTMPEGADFEPGKVLVQVDPEADPAELAELLSQADGVVAREPSAEEIASGLIELELEDGVEVEDAVNELLALDSELIKGAQPNYVYYAMGVGNAADLRKQTEPLLLPSQLARAVKAEGSEGTAGDLLAQASTTVNDPGAKNQWALASIKAYDAWSLARGDQKVTVAVMDGGVSVTHEDLRANIISDLAYNAVTRAQGATNVLPDSALRDHASHVSGIISATANNGLGVAGVSYNACILPIKVFSGNSASTASVVNAYKYLEGIASSQNVRVVNLSVGRKDTGTMSSDDRAVITAIANAFNNKNIVTVAAAGNWSLNDYRTPFAAYPGDYSPVVSVINLKQAGSGVARDESSNYNVDNNRRKNISAPGASIYSTVANTNGYGTMSGTSMSAPCVAGVLALEFAANAKLTAAQAVDILYSTATDLGTKGWDREFGYGEVNAASAAQRARSGTGKSDISGATVTLSQDTFIYDGKAKTPAVTVKLGNVTLVNGSDYSLSYANNVNVGTATVTITATGSYYSGTTYKTFRIARYSIANASVSYSPGSFTYNGDACTPQVTVRMGSTTLRRDTDYYLSYANNVNAGTATLTVAGKGDYVGTVTRTYPIARRSLGEASIEIAPLSTAYTGANIQPSATVTYNGRTLAAGTDYDISYANNVKVGEATVTLVGKGNFVDTVTKTFTITRAESQWRRLSGPNALDTMSAIVSEGGFAGGGVVVLATVGGYWDALTAAGLAGMANAPVVMTSSNELSGQARAQLEALRPTTVVACGGTSSISDDVLVAARDVAGATNAVRVSGANAVETANQIYAQAPAITGNAWSNVGFVCTGEGYWDALSSAPVSYAKHMPIFLCSRDSIAGTAIEAMRAGGVTEVFIVGGTSSIAPAVEDQLRAGGISVLGRMSGATAVETSTQVAEYGVSQGMGANYMGVASSGGYWDALAGAALSGKMNAVLVLVSGAESSSINDFVGKYRADIATGFVFGGDSSVSDDALNALITVSRS